MGGMGGREALSVRAITIIMALVLCLGWPNETSAYAVLAHEAIIDSVWDTNIRPLLLKRFPDATAEELKEAHGYAYGGAIIQDMGYYPHGSFFFSYLTHYVRSGDFVLAPFLRCLGRFVPTNALLSKNEEVPESSANRKLRMSLIFPFDAWLGNPQIEGITPG